MAGRQMNGAGAQLFSVEQIELLRRLRNSGITKEQLMQAFDVMERLDHELGPVFSVPMAQIYAHTGFSRNSFAYPTAAGGGLPAKATVAPATPPVASPVMPILPRKMSLDSGDNGMDVELSNGSSQGSADDGRPAGGPKVACDVSDEMKEFMSQGPLHCCEEVRQFVIKYNIKQQQVATLAGVSQSYVSRYMKGDYFDMSERSLIAIHQWYLTYKDNVAAIVPSVNAVLQSSLKPHPGYLASVGATTPDQLAMSMDFMNAPRRERFVFRPNHLEILDRSFQQESYPTHEKRDSIAQECNAVTEAIVGRHLAEKERVSPQIVSNWFANKRKDMKKIAREEGLDMSQVPFRSRGRPSRIFSDLAMPHELVMSTPSTPESMVMNSSYLSAASMSQHVEPVAPPPTCVAVNGHQVAPLPAAVADAVPSVELAAPAVEYALPAVESSPPPAVAPPDELNGEVDRDLSLSVEIAAVNQAIMALTGQQPIRIKAESKSDDDSPALAL